MYRYLRYVPKNHLSRLVGRLVHIRLPRPVARGLVRWFAETYEIDVATASEEIHTYDSIGSFFVRDLREGLRPIEGDFVSPVDGVLRNFGEVTEGRLEQIKGKTYTLTRFLGDEREAKRYEGGAFFNLYLSPRDYHHVHAPLGGSIPASMHIPGKLWPVNDWSLRTIEELFSINERVITYIDSPLGCAAVVMIGATNVGTMSVTYDSFVTNRPGAKATRGTYAPAPEIRAGDRLGTFHMGSSVVVLLEPGKVALAKVRLTPGQHVRYGEAVINV